MNEFDKKALSRPVLPFAGKYSEKNNYKSVVKTYNNYVAFLRFREFMKPANKIICGKRPFLSLTGINYR